MNSFRFEVYNFWVDEEGVPEDRESRAPRCYLVLLRLLDADQESWMPRSGRSAKKKVEEWPRAVANC